MDEEFGSKNRAEWIWIRPPRRERAGLIPRGESDFSDDRNRFVYFRKEFEAPAGIRGACLRASADGRYILFLNGKRLGRGPARCHPGWQCLDPFEAGDLILPGKNVLAALVHSYGRDSSFYQLPRGTQALLFGCAGFYLDGSLGLGTNGSWKCLASEAWERDTPFGGTGYMEHFDGRKEPEGWELPGFDDSAWGQAFVQRVSIPAAGSDVVPFPRLVDRGIGLMREEKVLPPGRPRPAPGGGLVWDFGRILLGRIGVEVEAEAGAGVELTCGESLGPDGGVFRPGAIPGIFTPPSQALRFRAGSFACSDELLTRIWRVGAYTASVCRQDGFIDCPSREQRQ
ncbi:MAG: family 78 glycoside hydrolase catalytic domain [Spirochaetes bacterium]|nr:family 78 glycoside hydrolase catalytic domain [Spirochaetota bacterium]